MAAADPLALSFFSTLPVLHPQPCRSAHITQWFATAHVNPESECRGDFGYSVTLPTSSQDLSHWAPPCGYHLPLCCGFSSLHLQCARWQWQAGQNSALKFHWCLPATIFGTFRCVASKLTLNELIGDMNLFVAVAAVPLPLLHEWD